MKRNSFFFKLRRIALCLMVLFMLETAITPKPAEAFVMFEVVQLAENIWKWITDAANWVVEELKLTKMVANAIELYNIIKDGFGALIDETKKNGILHAFAQRLGLTIDIGVTDARIAAANASEQAAARAAYAAEHAPPITKTLCKSVLIYQLVDTTEDFEREVSRMAAEAVANRSRVAGSGGPLEIAGEYKHRKENLGMKDPTEGDQPAKPTSKDSLLIVNDKDVINKLVSYELPKLITETYTNTETGAKMTIRHPEYGPKLTDEQRNFNAYINNIFLKAGIRPTPISGASLVSPKGLVQRAMFNHCAANENALIKQCTDLLAHHTRPNNEDTRSEPLRNAQNERCELIATSIGMNEETKKRKYGNCKKGLSGFEAMNLVQEWCKSTQFSVGMKGAGASDDEITRASDLCANIWTSGQALQKQLEDNCNAATANFSKIKECWTTVKELGGGMTPASASVEGGGSSSYHEIKSRQSDQPTWRVHKINDIKLQTNIPSGRPISADEIALPVAIGQ